MAGKRLWLQFDGVNTVADVWINGVHLGQHRGGYATFASTRRTRCGPATTTCSRCGWTIRRSPTSRR
ncbi:hypothetical protein [Amycolatopsis sp. FDAARGOS 1241]|uniref:hypothetical protein n=1 Tax=Amycolatopsis sp. FDAARGOS 1241 TaxID=2778070 RepID=UPI0019511508|nr:hypothetical protein I6J71_06590 [Amycolatopsis sp. FDAARGOS 1241]